ncbi:MULTISPECIES: response regulator [Actinomadura]|uniref:DNA-binding NarL/FixJ family response regulator n=2 Tax=Actinomadura TaxID=1988 RepID=A0A7X0FWD8_9ACTN|nr:response regulator transcription factor [Actinomadura citrea]MBB6394402.1 DNA-binding NarL/FixJ family response regulator [Actinomadura coerulea]NYE13429.1 DNA-binding NarL/FixJ family response regulator [Actinomadura citrea]GGQ40831.1 DNA-binding response regulator [Actinomadura coerulea]GGT85984.1 DNA-binding response regulator [Actinomadura citrea]
MTIRVLIADDQVMIRDGLAALLSSDPGIEVIGQAGNGREAVEMARRLDPDVVVMDIRMPEMDGLAATAELAGSPDPDADPAGARPKVLMLTTFDLDEYVYEALGAGASGFLLKDASAADLVNGVRVVAAGDALLAPSITRRLIGDFARRRRHQRPSPKATAGLTPRELDVLRLMARGLSNAEIAAELVLAEQTVKTHVGHVLTKLGLRDRTQAVVYAYENGLVG